METQNNLLTKMFVISVLIFIMVGCASMLSRYNKVKEIDTIEAYEEFIQKYPDSEFAKEAKKSIEELKYEKTKSENTIEAFQRFIEKYPGTEFLKEANKRIEKLEYEKSKSENTIEAFQRFIERYPDTEFLKKANEGIEELEYEKAKSKNTIEAYQRFMDKRPDSKFASEARDKIETQKDFKTAKTENTIKAFEKFVEEHPKSNFIEKAKGKIKEITLENIKIIRMIYNTSPENLDRLFYNPERDIAKTLSSAGFRVVSENSQDYDVTMTVDYEENKQRKVSSRYNKEGVFVDGTGEFWALMFCNIKMDHAKFGNIFKVEFKCSSEISKIEGRNPQAKWDKLFTEAESKFKNQFLNKTQFINLIKGN